MYLSNREAICPLGQGKWGHFQPSQVLIYGMYIAAWTLACIRLECLVADPDPILVEARFPKLNREAWNRNQRTTELGSSWR